MLNISYKLSIKCITMIKIVQKNILLFVCFFQIAIVSQAQQISGNIFIDRDGLTDNNITKSAGINNPTTNINAALYANLLNSSDLAVATVLINALGAYSFSNVSVGVYKVQLSSISSVGTYANPIIAPATLLPAGWVNTGENIGYTNGNDGSVNGMSSIINMASGNIVAAVNFGIERLPETANVIAFIGVPINAEIISLQNILPWSGPNFYNEFYSRVFLGYDNDDDLPILGELTGKTIRVDTLINFYNSMPPQSIAQFDLIYLGVLVSQGQVITSYNPAFMQVRCLTNYVGSLDNFGGNLKFKYSYIDAAGKADPTPATFKIFFPVAGLLPINLSDFSISQNNCNAVLNWKTSSEINADKFEIEYSNTTNSIFKVLGEKTAAGNSTTTKSYQFGYTMESGIEYFFRLKMYQKDGSFTYSDIKKLSCKDGKTEINILPNLTSNVFRVTGMSASKNVLKIFSTDGKLLKTFTVSNNQNVDISNLKNAVYILKITNENGNIFIDKIVKY